MWVGVGQMSELFLLFMCIENVGLIEVLDS